MKQIVNLKNSLFKSLISKVFENTLLTIVFSVIIGAYIPKIFEHMSVCVILIIVSAALFIYGIYYLLAHEKILKKASMNEKDFKNEWQHSEIRFSPITFVNKGGLYVQFSDLPVLLNYDTPEKFTLEFKARIQNSCFSWCVNAEIKQSVPCGYMFQYDQASNLIRPHILLGLNANNASDWATPGGDGLLNQIPCQLKQKDGWYWVRTEVRIDESPYQSFGPDKIKEAVEFYRKAYPHMKYDETKHGKIVEVIIYDMNYYGEQVAKYIFLEPPLKYFGKGKIGFRNYGPEASIYKEIVIKKLK